MNLLLHPLLREGEGPRGYLLRLAEANGLSIRSLSELGISFNVQCLGFQLTAFDQTSLIEYAGRIEWIRESHPAIWNGLTPRYCPECLANGAYWQVGWELYWCDACPEHRTWLIDRCPDCQGRLSWDRPSLLQCQCGAFLSNARPASCPDSIAALSELLVSKTLGEEGAHPYAAINALEIHHLNRLIRLIGAYGDGGWQLKPQKITNHDWMDVSWSVTSLAAEILFNRTSGVQQFLQNIYRRHRVPEDSKGRLPSRFGHFYRLLYRAFSEPSFEFLRREFENFLAAHWQGPMGRRNRNLPVSLLASLSWIPAKHACRQLGLSLRRLRTLIDQGKIVGERIATPKGRHFLVVRRADVEAMISVREDEIDLKTAMTLLGLKKKRMSGIIQWLLPNAHKTGPDGCPWAIPLEPLDKLSKLIARLPPREQDLEGEVSLSYVLRFWSWGDMEIGKLLRSLLEGVLIASARQEGTSGVSALIFEEAHLRDWHYKQFTCSSSMSIPEVAEALKIKQEVAYALVRQGLIPTVKERVGARSLTRVWPKTIDAFKQEYVFGRDLAYEVGTSPKALADHLQRLDIRPVLGPSVDGSRQYLYSTGDALNKALNQIHGRTA